MGNYRYVVTLPDINGMAEDVTVNTFYGVASDDAAAGSFLGTLEAFYNGVVGSGPNALGAYFGKSISRVANACSIKVYNLGDTEPRVPLSTTFFTMPTPIANDHLPREVALCLSFQTTPVSGAAQARRRGRVFLGPFNNAALATPGTEGDGRPAPALIQAAIDSAQALMANTIVAWSVHSTLSAVLLEVTQGWVDNAWDTQRRRGLKPSARNVFNSTTP